MYSCNVPVPAEVGALAGRLARDLPEATPRDRGTRTLVGKRLGGDDRASFQRLRARAREAIAGQPPFAARVTGLGRFDDPPKGSAPVVYLAVESPGLEDLHATLCEHFDVVDGLEGEGYVPHVTVARGGSFRAAERIVDRDVDPIEWTVEELVFYDAERGEEAGRIALPA